MATVLKPELREATRLTSARAGLSEEYLSTPAQIRPILERVLSRMRDYGYSEEDMFALRLALDEALINAIKHGHQGRVMKDMDDVLHLVEINRLDLTEPTIRDLILKHGTPELYEKLKGRGKRE